MHIMCIWMESHLVPQCRTDHELFTATVNVICLGNCLNLFWQTCFPPIPHSRNYMQDIDMLELFCGKAELSKQCRSLPHPRNILFTDYVNYYDKDIGFFGNHHNWGMSGIECHRFDRLQHGLHDLTTPEGSLVKLVVYRGPAGINMKICHKLDIWWMELGAYVILY